MSGRRPLPHWQAQGKEPDYRFSLANERTFLAWIRTALALLAGGLVFHQFATQLQPRWVVASLAAAAAALAGLLSGAAYLRWRANQIAMRHDRPLPSASLLPALAGLGFGVGMAMLGLLLAQ